jgi:uncharacterized cupredoxin-like copper-binding protein
MTLAMLPSRPAHAQPAEWSNAVTATVTLSSFSFAPKTLRLRAGQPVLLRLVNSANGGHNFAAREFFAAAQVRATDQALVRSGSVEVAADSSVAVMLIPRAGRYRLRCTHFLHTGFGMTGEIIVE